MARVGARWERHAGGTWLSVIRDFFLLFLIQVRVRLEDQVQALARFPRLSPGIFLANGFQSIFAFYGLVF